MSRRLNVVVRSLPSYERWAEMARQLPRGSDHPVAPNRLDFNFLFSRPLTGRIWMATLLFLFDRAFILLSPLISSPHPPSACKWQHSP